jgi:hypothetical protein
MKNSRSFLNGVAMIALTQVLAFFAVTFASGFGFGRSYCDGPSRLLDAFIFAMAFFGWAGFLVSYFLHDPEPLVFPFLVVSCVINALVIWTPLYWLRKRNLYKKGQQPPERDSVPAAH